jgi:GNAT superfamily N-acetyltransferase
MILIRKAGIKDIFQLKTLQHKQDLSRQQYLSNFNGSIPINIILGSCFAVESNNKLAGFLIMKRKDNDLFFIPGNSNGISFFRLMHVLQKNFNLSGYAFSLEYRGVKAGDCSKYYNVEVIRDIKLMSISTHDISDIKIDSSDSIGIRNMKIKSDENIRVQLQNSIFSHVKNRKNITVQEVLAEEDCSDFLEDMCFIFEVAGCPAGYGQILLTGEDFYLVNFGIIPEYRGKNYGHYFLIKIIEKCLANGISDLNLTVDNTNLSAINLYKRVGFKEVHNSITLFFK